ncbi:hypothetical protein T479_09680 [Lysinibacillus varians]|nr:hypothetical protein T479_09680 [Lysinibacillus varians]
MHIITNNNVSMIGLLALVVSTLYELSVERQSSIGITTPSYSNRYNGIILLSLLVICAG